ncbi:DNA gyrase subunit B [Candidatus Nesciobacter abundans]|uniref:DNA topoisomerase (ATP-hydrolyzing) n=1 Tax=Candidatus Nesciobacter abundans TaxID=2601668 RepID=A0A5C0UHD8_9PROT|nr:DNA gyrase subunit B [Candidatus Nesciobacter abundans]QEK39169.1 DNA gyrase subunit B [Candidatus Nesciobacter abundans]
MNNNYSAESIQVLKGLEAVRKRPGMYIGDTDDGSGLHHLVYEIVDNSIDEALAGYCENVSVTICKDGSVSVEDDGRGIPVDTHAGEKMSAAEVIMTQLHAGGKFSSNAYKVSGGLHGVGASVVNALSVWMEVVIWRDSLEHVMRFERGKTVQVLKVNRELKGKESKRTGTKIHFFPDEQIFSNIIFEKIKLFNRFQELVYLNPGVKINLLDERDGSEEKLHDEGGVTSFVKSVAKRKKMVHPEPINIKSKNEEMELSCSMVWTESYYETSLFFTNAIPQKDGGTHMQGFRSGLTRAVQSYIKNSNNKNYQKVSITGEDIREGLACVLSVKVADPKFSSQTKEKLVSSNVRSFVESAVFKDVYDWLEEHPSETKIIIQRIISSSSAREAARKARDMTRKQKNGIDFQVLKKLAGCSEKDPAKCELFIVEGDSAGGSAKQARNRFVQAVLPLRGKILNVEKARFDKMLSSAAITTLISSLGTGIGEDFDVEKIRYHKIIIMTDADVDGKHILSLLLTFFFRYMRAVIDRGYLYIAQPPLYGLKRHGKIVYVRDEKEFLSKLIDMSKDLAIEDFEMEQEKLKLFLKDANEVKNKIVKKSDSWRVMLASKAFDGEVLGVEHVGKMKEYLESKGFNVSVSQSDSIFVIEKEIDGIREDIKIDISNITSDEFRLFNDFTKNWSEFWKEDPVELFDKIIKKARKGIVIQRYKGLGEMNPEDLSETAMKTYQVVKIDSYEESDRICIDLMGEEVEERRCFIERNAEYADLDT